MTLESRVLFTSIPKCGKNVVYSFLGALGLSPLPVTAEVGAASYLSHMSGGLARASHAYPRPAPEARAATATSAVAAALADGPAGSVVHGHLAFDPTLAEAARARGAPIVFVYRDPADMVLSAAQYVRHRRLPDHLWGWYGHLDLDDLIVALTRGDERLLSVAELYQAFAGWREQPDVVSLRFEDMVGPRGGGAADTQRAVLAMLATHVGWRGSDAELTSAIDVAFNPRAGTFFRGQIGTAARDFAPHVRAAFADSAGAVQAAWGYRPLGSADETSSEETIALLRNEVDRAWATLRSTVARLRSEHDSRLDLAYAESGAHRANLADLQRRLAAVTQESQQRKASLVELQRRLVAVEAENATRAANLNEVQERLAFRAAEREELLSHVSTLERRLLAGSGPEPGAADREDLQRRLAAAETKSATRGANLIEIQGRLIELQAENAARQASLNEVQERLTDSEAERQKLHACVDDLRRQLHAAKAERAAELAAMDGRDVTGHDVEIDTEPPMGRTPGRHRLDPTEHA
ncbi:MAG: hypothetical protein IT305_27285 [Chloroflexi bacterium]|nr:hypothetical protein [Chloroflexota bacterium]